MRVLAQQRPVTADTSLPVLGASAGAKTLAAYRWLKGLKGKQGCVWGIADRHDVSVAGSYNGALDAFYTQTGKYPALYTLEYHDTDWVTGFTGANGWQTNLTNEIQRAFGLGVKILSVNAHMGNPVTGVLSRNGQTGAISGAPGYSQDRASSPLAAIKTGGAQEAQFTAWMDRFFAFVDGITYGGNKMPVIVRLFHENTGASFWWAGSDRLTDYVLVWQKMVNYFKTTKSATNMLFCWHADTYDASALPRWSEWYPGDAYVDIVSFSRYNDASPASIDDASRLMETGCNNLRAIAPAKIWALGECGFVADDTANLWDQRLCQPMTTRHQDFSYFTTWRNDPAALKWGPGGNDSAARKASAAAAVLDPNVITADRCPL